VCCPHSFAKSACVIEISGRRRPAIAGESVASAFSGYCPLFFEKASQLIGCQGAQFIAFLVQLFGQLTVGRVQLKQYQRAVGSALFHVHVTRGFFGVVPDAPDGGIDQFAIFEGFHVQLSLENEGGSGAKMPMKMTEVLGIPAVQHTDMTRVINIQNGAPVTDGEGVIRVL